MKTNGFTLVELLFTVAILAIVLTLGIPSMTDFIDRSRATTEHRELVKTVNLARSEAITRGLDVNLSALSGSDWEKGFRIWVDADGDATYDAGEELREFGAFRSNADLSVTSNVSNFTFTSEGFLNATPGTVFIFNYRTNPAHCSLDRNIRLRHTGHISVEERSCP
jgi:type IV fimbrial biogenesis protein FimT